MSLGQILDGLTAYLKDRQDEGETWVECSPAAVKAITRPLPPPSPISNPQSPVLPPPSSLILQPSSFSSLESLATQIAACARCGLCKGRTRTVPGQGHPHPELVFVGEGPGADEDLQGLAFVGAAGQLLTRLILRMGLTREEVWIGNVVKCRPPGNRVPEPDEMQACLPYLRAQLALLKPKVIVTLGATALKGLIDVKTGITKVRGQWLSFDGIDLMPTFHPSYLLRGGGDERARYWDVWQDMEAVLARLGKPIPTQKSRPDA